MIRVKQTFPSIAVSPSVASYQYINPQQSKTISYKRKRRFSPWVPRRNTVKIKYFSIHLARFHKISLSAVWTILSSMSAFLYSILQCNYYIKCPHELKFITQRNLTANRCWANSITPSQCGGPRLKTPFGGRISWLEFMSWLSPSKQFSRH